MISLEQMKEKQELESKRRWRLDTKKERESWKIKQMEEEKYEINHD